MSIELDPRFDGAHTDLARALAAAGTSTKPDEFWTNSGRARHACVSAWHRALHAVSGTLTKLSLAGIAVQEKASGLICDGCIRGWTRFAPTPLLALVERVD